MPPRAKDEGPKKPPRLVLIEWLDSRNATEHWEHFSEADRTVSRCRSVGWLMEDGEVKLVMPHLADVEKDDPQTYGGLAIPASAVVKLVDLAEVGARKQPRRR